MINQSPALSASLHVQVLLQANLEQVESLSGALTNYAKLSGELDQGWAVSGDLQEPRLLAGVLSQSWSCWATFLPTKVKNKLARDVQQPYLG